MAKRNIITLALTVMFVLGLAVGASAGIPDSNNSLASSAEGRTTIAPGGGDLLSDGDYTISVTILDINGDPVVGLVATDMWVRTYDMAPCSGTFSQADAATDGTGSATFSGTIYGGVTNDGPGGVDCDTNFLYVYAQGIELNAHNPVDVAVDSPDLNGDLAVGVTDFAKFAVDFNCATTSSACDPCHDFDENGATDIGDFAIFGAFFNVSVCP
ncbi:MAG: hypothetical protein GY835_06255 [bacterium]|nr:hypothetical protein [bacterium]